MTVNRQPAGIPTGGRYAPDLHAEPEVGLAPAAPSVAELSALRDRVRDRLEHTEEQSSPLTAAHQALSVKMAAAHIREAYPDAECLVLRANVDGENQMDPFRVVGRDGRILEDADEDGGWTYAEAGTDGPELGELTLCLADESAPSWAAGIVEESDDRHEGRLFRIDLDKAIAAPTPETDGPLAERALTAEEQELLVDAAWSGLAEMDDLLKERAMDYSEEDLARVRERRDRLADLLEGKPAPRP